MNPPTQRQRALLVFTAVMLILLGLVGCDPSAADLEAVDYALLQMRSGYPWEESSGRFHRLPTE